MNALTRKRFLPLLIAATLVGCSNETDTKEQVEVAATVNGAEITVHQLNLAMGAMKEKTLNPDDQAALRKAVLNNMVIQTLLEQQAEKTDLDREPYVMEAMEAAKRRVLASAYMQQMSTVNTAVPEADIKQYYSDNTDLFSNRKLFVYEQVTVQAEVEEFDAVKNKASELDNLDEFVIWLQKRSTPYKVITEAKTSEYIPQNLLKPLSTLDVGQVGYLTLNDGLIVVEVKDKQRQPIAYEMAEPAISQLLQSQRQQAQLKQTVRDLKAAAKIEYAEAFKASNTSASAENTETVETDLYQESYIEKGLQGL